MIKFKSLLIVSIGVLFLMDCTNKIMVENFIKRDGCLLKDGDSTFRFLSFNIPNINFIEDEMEFTKLHPFRLPTSFEIRDAFESVRQMGGTVVRAYTFPVRRKTDTLDIPRYVLGPGEFDEKSFEVMDTVLAIANEMDIRLILPLLDNWKWMGGVPQYADFRNKEADEFWTDTLLIGDFKATIDYILNRVNTVTGTRYKDDKAILCWETGNELSSPYSWTKEMASYIKSIDTNHLIMDGYNAIDGANIHEDTFADSLIDIITTHHYKLNPAEIIDDIKMQLKRINKRKAYIIGEFGFLGTPAIEEISNYIIAHDSISGGLIWSLRYHRNEGGFYWHSEPFGGDIFKAFHYPGFQSGIKYNEENLFRMFRQKSFEIKNEIVPEIDIPDSPQLLPLNSCSEISWQGSAGAKYYDVERSESISGPWKIVGFNISDADQYYTPIFNDNSAEVGKKYYYKIIAKNSSGNSVPSNIVGPVKCVTRTLIDEMKNLTAMYYYEGEIIFKQDMERRFKEDPHRIKVNEGCELYYYVPGKITSFRLYTFSVEDSSTLKFYLSEDGIYYEGIQTNRVSYFLGEGDYEYWIPNKYSSEITKKGKSYNYLKYEVQNTNQVSRVEINYIPSKIFQNNNNVKNLNK